MKGNYIQSSTKENIMKKKAPKRRSHKKRDHLRSDLPLIEETKFNRFTDFLQTLIKKRVK